MSADPIRKAISSIISAHKMAEGVGATVYRSIGSRKYRQLSPFLLLDFMETSNTQASFPDHPHRGLETLTYVLSGNIEHEDFTGSKGTLNPGDCQVMTAGKGIMHAEIPRPPPSPPNAAATGIQLWVDLPADLKKIEPNYKDIRSSSIPVSCPAPGVTLHSLSYEGHSVTKTPIWFLYYKSFGKTTGLKTPDIPAGWSSFLYVTKGQLSAHGKTSSSVVSNTLINQENIDTDNNNNNNSNNKTLQSKPTEDTTIFNIDNDSSQVQVGIHDLVVYEQNNEIPEPIEIGLPLHEQVEFLICAGLPLDQPIYRDMFFVQLSKEALRQSKVDFREKINGFEKAKNWKSKIAGDIDFKLHI